MAAAGTHLYSSVVAAQCGSCRVSIFLREAIISSIRSSSSSIGSGSRGSRAQVGLAYEYCMIIIVIASIAL